MYKDNLCLRIAKGKPRDASYHELKADMSNMILEAQRAAGLAPSGFQPDIVLTFYNTSNKSPECVTFLADAKFNESDDGRHYISPSIQKSAIYVHAFSKHLRANPKCTLFFWQGVTKYFGHDIANDANLDDIVSNNSYTYPEIQSFDRRIFDNDRLFMSWFETLEDFARGKLISPKNK